MIEFDFAFFQPNTIAEARSIYEEFSQEGKKIIYYSGGTEFISRARAGEISPNIVIDLKNLPACQVYEIKDRQLYIGSAIPLSRITDQPLFPLLSQVVKNIATRTARNKITIGGNICSHLPYKEALLPFLLAEAEISIATKNGIEIRPILEIFHLTADEILLQIITDVSKLDLTSFYEKRTKQAKVNYPILTMAAMKNNEQLRIAIAGLSKQPFSFLVNQSHPVITSVEQTMMDAMKGQVITDDLASEAYRLFVCQTMLKELIAEGIEK